MYGNGTCMFGCNWPEVDMWKISYVRLFSGMKTLHWIDIKIESNKIKSEKFSQQSTEIPRENASKSHCCFHYWISAGIYWNTARASDLHILFLILFHKYILSKSISIYQYIVYIYIYKYLNIHLYLYYYKHI